MPRLADSQLDGVRSARDDGTDRGCDVFDPRQEGGFVKEAVVDGDIKAIAVGAKEPVQPSDAELIAGCELAREYHVASVCIKPSSVPLAARILQGSDVLVGTVVGFPHGSSTTRVKVFEARQALDDGAAELDMVINIGWLRS